MVLRLLFMKNLWSCFQGFGLLVLWKGFMMRRIMGKEVVFILKMEKLQIIFLRINFWLLILIKVLQFLLVVVMWGLLIFWIMLNLLYRIRIFLLWQVVFIWYLLVMNIWYGQLSIYRILMQKRLLVFIVLDCMFFIVLKNYWFLVVKMLQWVLLVIILI